jgi:hypothetical protein
MPSLLCASLQLLALVVAAVNAVQDAGSVPENSSDSDLVRAYVDAASFSVVQLHEDKDFS